MEIATDSSLLEKIANLIRFNSRFHKYYPDKINQEREILISPVEATLIYSGKINKNHNLTSKFNREIDLSQAIENPEFFSDGFYIGNNRLTPLLKQFALDFTEVSKDYLRYMCLVDPGEKSIRIVNKGLDDMPLFFHNIAQPE